MNDPFMEAHQQRTQQPQEHFKTNSDYLRDWGKERLVAEIRAAGYTDDAIVAEIARNEQGYRAEHPEQTEYRDYISMNEKLDRVERKLDDILAFVDQVKQTAENFANNGGMFAGMLRNILPKG